MHSSATKLAREIRTWVISSVTTNAAELVMLEMSLAMLFVTCVEIRAEILEHLNHGLKGWRSRCVLAVRAASCWLGLIWIIYALVRPNKNGSQVGSEFLKQLHQLLCRESVDFTLHMRVVSKEATKIKIKDLAVLLCLAREVSCLSQLDLQLRKAWHPIITDWLDGSPAIGELSMAAVV